MRSLTELELAIDAATETQDLVSGARQLLAASEEALEHWVVARGSDPTDDTREGFRLLALHKQGTKGDPSFNACRETCREIAFHFNLITMQPEHAETTHRLDMMKMISRHLTLFISGKMQESQLGDFCCSAKPIRLNKDDTTSRKEA